MILNNYQVLNLINNGTFGNVYKCIYNNKIYAIKEDSNYKTLKYEATIYKLLLNIDNVSNFYDFFTINDKHYLVLDYYNITLNEYRIRFFNSKDYIIRINNIFTSLINTLQSIHNKNIIHRDLKPSNICLDKNYNPYIIDFGLAKKYINNGYHIAENNIKNIIGSTNFISLNVVKLIQPSRRDDLESIIFIYIYTILSDSAYLKYNNLKIEYKKDLMYIKNILITDKIDANIITNIFNSLLYIRRLRFSQVPNYIFLTDKLTC